jgi:hypothetical protein
MANAMALFKNHLPDLDMEILRKDFTIDDVKREAVANSAYDTAHEFVSLYDFSRLTESDDNNSPTTDGYRYIDAPYFPYADDCSV